MKSFLKPPSFSFSDLKLVDITGIDFLQQSRLFSFKHTYPFEMVQGEHVIPPKLFFTLPKNFLPSHYPQQLRLKIFKSEVKYCLELYEKLKAFNENYYSFIKHHYLFHHQKIDRQYTKNNQGIRMLGRALMESVIVNKEVITVVKEDNNLFLSLSFIIREGEFSDLVDEFSIKVGKPEASTLELSL